MIINHDHYRYRRKWNRIGKNRFNGAFYYSKEICKYIIPYVKTDRNWITINIQGCGCDRAIVFIHNNLHPEHYDWLKQYDDLVLVCGIPETVPKVAHLGHAVYLPLSVNVDYVESFRVKHKTKDTAFVGRSGKKTENLPPGIDYLVDMPRTRLLKELAQYEKVYAVGRCAVEAKILGCEILPYDDRFPDTERWQVVDNREAAAMLQRMLDEIDGRKGE